MNRGLARRAEQLSVVLIIVGILCMIQPVALTLLSYGFVITLAGMIGFTVFSHL